MSYETHWEENGVVWIFSGVTNSEEILQANMELYNHERAEELFYQILDFTPTERVILTEEDVIKFAALDYGSSHYIKKMKVALVSEDTNLKSLFLKYMQTSTDMDSRWSFGIFEDMDGAREWVNSDSDA